MRLISSGNLSILTHSTDDLESNSIVVYLRMLTSAQIRLDPENFAPFLFHPELGEPMEIRDFCEHFVDATGKEAGIPKAILNLCAVCSLLSRPCPDDSAF